ncbi:MAG TPA: ROK family protein [Acidobacteriaceae bacterium]|nr:ROK family protein [Acidobacteriaceae bacterium]
MRILAVDLGGTHASCALVEGGRILDRETIPVPGSGSFADALAAIAGPLARMHADAPAAGIGFGFCGLVDSRRSRIASTDGKYEDAVTFDLAEWARAQFGLPLRLENDARLALLGERHAGAAQGESDVVMFTLGTGIGGVAMIDGHLLRGKHDQAGVLAGHTPVTLHGRRCTCGGLGCAESEASGWALPLVAKEWPGFAHSALAASEINFANLFSRAAEGDSVARELVDHCLHVWAAAAVGAIHAFDPDLLIYGGGVMRSADAILPYIQNYVRDNAWTPWGTVRVRAAQLGNDAALLGVVPLFATEQSLAR